MKQSPHFATISVVKQSWKWGLAAPLGLAVPVLSLALVTPTGCSGDDGSLPCNDHQDCLLQADCCRCQAVHVDDSLPRCNLTCNVDRCFEEHGEASVAPRCVDNRCEVATTN